MDSETLKDVLEAEVQIPSGGHRLRGTLSLPVNFETVVVFAHGSGSGRFGPRNRFVASALQAAGVAYASGSRMHADPACAV
jgi:putative phosphoribosyl transferase